MLLKLQNGLFGSKGLAHVAIHEDHYLQDMDILSPPAFDRLALCYPLPLTQFLDTVYICR